MRSENKEVRDDVSEVLSSAEHTVDLPLDRADPKESAKGRAEPNEAFFGSLLLFCLALSFLSATGYFGFAGYRYFKQIQAEKAIPSIEALPKTEVSQTPPEVAVPAAQETIPTAPTAVAEQPAVVDKKTLSIKVLNGGAAKGVAGTYTEKLKSAGFSKTVVGNAFGDYTGQVLYYSKGQLTEAEVIKAEVVKTYPALALKESPIGDKDALAATYVIILGR